jgi:phenylpropionate dioxygenase-like ring-hydroxylating dioxygenase large terminal subunit
LDCEALGEFRGCRTRAASGLSPIACEIWEGFVFINLARKPQQTLREFLGPLAQTLAGAPFAEYPYTISLSQEVQSNWKLGVEAASEGYHNQALHARSGRHAFYEGKPVHQLRYVGAIGAASHGNSAADPRLSPARESCSAKFAFEGVGQMFVEGDTTSEQAARGFLGHPGINPSKSPLFQIDQYWLFPNASINIAIAINGWWCTTYWPITKDRSMWRTTFFYEHPSNLRELFARHYALALQRDIFTEDNSCFQKQQAMFQSGGKPFIQLGESEILLRHLAAVLSGIDQKIRPSEPQSPGGGMAAG